MSIKNTRREVALKMPQAMYDRLAIRSSELGCTVHVLIRLLLTNWLESATPTENAKMKKPPTGERIEGLQ